MKGVGEVSYFEKKYTEYLNIKVKQTLSVSFN